MRLSSGLNYMAATVAAMLLLSGCATGPKLQAAKPPLAATARTLNPAVKIGQPYLVLGKWYYPKDDRDYDVTGVASWYGPGFHGLSTANGEPYDQDGITAAHKTLPLPCFVEVTNLENGRTLTVRINDRGPFVGERIIDLSRRSAQLLGIDRAGTAKVRVRRVFPERAEVAALAPSASARNAARDRNRSSNRTGGGRRAAAERHRTRGQYLRAGCGAIGPGPCRVAARLPQAVRQHRCRARRSGAVACPPRSLR